MLLRKTLKKQLLLLLFATLLLIYILIDKLHFSMEYKFVGVDIVEEEIVYKKGDVTKNFFSFDTTQLSGNFSLDTVKKARIKTYYEGILKREEAERPKEEWCKSPAFDPFNKEALSTWDFENTEKCTVKRYGRIKNGRLLIPDDWRLIKQARITYILRGRKRLPNGKLDIPKRNNDLGLEVHRRYKYTSVNNEDFHVHFGKHVYLKYDSENKRYVSDRLLTDDFFMLEMLMKNGPNEKVITEYHAHIHDPVKVCRRLHGTVEGSTRSKLGNFKTQSSKRNIFSMSEASIKKQQTEKLESHLNQNLNSGNSTKNQIKEGGSKKNSKSRTHPLNDLKYNVAMIMLDAQSRHNIYRQLPRLMQLLHNGEKDDVMLFRRHGIHGDGTVCQLMAALAGYHYSESIQNPWEYPNDNDCDEIPNSAFKLFSKAGYSTMFNEDSATGGLFQFRMNGFKKPPTDWYPRPYWIAAHERNDGCGRQPCVCETQQMIRMIKHYTETCEDSLKFSVNLLSQAHDEMNNLHMVENEIIDLVKFFTENERRCQNTILFLFSDHGPRAGAKYEFRNTQQGRIEEFMPFYSILLPPEFKTKHKELYLNMKSNTGVLTSHFDVYSTLKHILSYPKLPDKHKYGQSLFTKINPKTRTCNQTGIPERYCFCSNGKPVKTDTKLALELGKAVVDRINTLISSYEEAKPLCAELSLKEILNINVQIAGTDTELYNIMLLVAPSNATFDADVTRDEDGEIKVNPDISRTNLYGSQSMCVKYKYPKLAFFCYCKQNGDG